MTGGAATAERVAIVGGAGFVGRRLVDLLAARGASVRVVDLVAPDAREGLEWVRCDVQDAGELQKALAGAETVFNLAAAHGLTEHPPALYRGINEDGARSVCAAASACGAKRIVFASSAAVYGHGAAPDERTVPAPRSRYATSKLAAEDVYRAWAGERAGRGLVVVRPTVVFGPGGDGAGDRLLRAAAGPVYIQVGDGRNRKSLAFVDNLASFLAFVGAGPQGVRVFNYADAPDVTLSEIVSTVRAALGLRAAIRRPLAFAYVAAAGAALAAHFGGRPSPGVRSARRTIRRLSREMRFDAAAAHASGFHQPVPLREAIAATVRTDLAALALLGRRR